VMENLFRCLDCSPEGLQSPPMGKRKPILSDRELLIERAQDVTEKSAAQSRYEARSDKQDSGILSAQKKRNEHGFVSKEDISSSLSQQNVTHSSPCLHEASAPPSDRSTPAENIKNQNERRESKESDGSSSSHPHVSDDRLQDRAWNINMASVMAWKAGGRVFRAAAARAVLQSGDGIDDDSCGRFFQAAQGSLKERLLTLFPVLLFRFAPMLIVLGEVLRHPTIPSSVQHFLSRSRRMPSALESSGEKRQHEGGIGE
jgi:hypothetical protein